MLTYKQYQEDREGKIPPPLNGIVSKSISNLNEQDKQLLFPGMADDMEKEFQQTKRGQEIQRVFKDVQDGVAKEIDQLIDRLKDHLHAVVHPHAVANQSFDSGIGGTTEDPGMLRQAMKLHYKDLPQYGAARKKARINIPAPPTAENYQITLKQHNEFKRTLDSLDEVFLIEVGPIDWAKSKIGSGLDKVAPGVKDKLKGWWQNAWHGSRNPLNPQNLQKWDVALDDILDTFSTQLKGRVKGIISQQFDPSKGLISKHIQNLAKPYHKDTGSSPTKPSEAPEASSATSSKDSGEEAPEAPEATETPAHGKTTAKIGSKPSKPRILTKKQKLNKWFTNNILPDFSTDEGIDLDGLKARLEKDGYDSDVIETVIKLAGQKKWDVRDLIGDEPSSEEEKLQAPTISGDPEKNAIDRVDRIIGKLPKNSAISREDVKALLDDGDSEDEIIRWAEKHSTHHGDVSEHDHHLPEECLPEKKGIKSLEEYLREAEAPAEAPAPAPATATTPATPAAPATPAPRPISNHNAAKKLLEILDARSEKQWRLQQFTNLETGLNFENPEEIMDEDLNTWVNNVVKVWKDTKKIQELNEKDVENMANYHLDLMGFDTPADYDSEHYDWMTKRGKEKSLDQISKIE
jgi:hypothetical protein